MVITITVARPTAAEQTMQPASISENSRRSVAACISCRAQATRATTADTIARAMVVARGEERGESTDTERFNRAESGNKLERSAATGGQIPLMRSM